MFIRCKRRIYPLAFSKNHPPEERTGAQQKRNHRPADCLALRLPIHGRGIPEPSLFFRDQGKHPLRQRLIQSGLAHNYPVIQAGNHLQKPVQQIRKGHPQKIKSQPDPICIDPRLFSLRYQRLQEGCRLLPREYHRRSPETPCLHKKLFLLKNPLHLRPGHTRHAVMQGCLPSPRRRVLQTAGSCSRNRILLPILPIQVVSVQPKGQNVPDLNIHLPPQFSAPYRNRSVTAYVYPFLCVRLRPLRKIRHNLRNLDLLGTDCLAASAPNARIRPLILRQRPQNHGRDKTASGK